ncbi:hypothetical protein GCM10010946_26260 [Undibacterium squillarum]|uniref:Uncharacterized protein n=1 Tax=Undibacterium squillarum TaxID=1131567 RepID=A0ABQ2Y0R4_9BURK|nr:hypothetical protein GCM10010946_26260 [Undibacterium squillarum]
MPLWYAVALNGLIVVLIRDMVFPFVSDVVDEHVHILRQTSTLIKTIKFIVTIKFNYQ